MKIVFRIIWTVILLIASWFYMFYREEALLHGSLEAARIMATIIVVGVGVYLVVRYWLNRNQ